LLDEKRLYRAAACETLFLRADMKKGAYAKQDVRRSELQISSGTFVQKYHIVKHNTCQT